MEELALYAERGSFVHRANPLTKLAGVLLAVTAAFALPWPFPGPPLGPWLVFLIALLPLACLAGVARPFLKAVAAMFLPFAFFLFLVHGLFHPSGGSAAGDELARIWIFSVQKGPLLYAFGVAGRILAMVGAFSLLFLTTHPGRLMQDLQQRGVGWGLAYVVSATLQLLPAMRARAGAIIQAQRARGLETGGSPLRRAKALLPLARPLFYGVLQDVEERALALEARGVTRKGKRHYLHAVADTRADRAFRLLFLGAALAVIGARLWCSLR